MNDEKKDPNPATGGASSADAFPPEDDDNPWDDDERGGRTLATEGPSFELPSNIPSPITVPAPPIPPKNRPSATLIGLMPDDFTAPLPQGGSPPPVVLADDDLAELSGQQDDGPTMVSASPALAKPPRRDDPVRPRLPSGGGSSPMIDDDAATMAFDGSDLRRPPPSRDAHEATRAISRDETHAMSRDEMMRHQDAHVVVGNDAIGDDATLAVAPGQIHLGVGRAPGGGDLGPSRGEMRAPREELPRQHQQQQEPQAPYFPNVAPQTYGGPEMPQAQASWQGDAALSYRNPPQQGFDPMIPQSQHGMQGPPQSHPMGWAPPSAPISYNPGMPQAQAQGMMQPAPPAGPWMNAPPPPAPGGVTIGGFRLTPQLVLLAGLGVVCLAIFVVGIVLFATTKF